jgi:hypothetical protein
MGGFTHGKREAAAQLIVEKDLLFKADQQEGVFISR